MLSLRLFKLQIMDINTYWAWNEFGFCFKISRTGSHSDYLFMIDFHFLFFDCWINFYSKK